MGCWNGTCALSNLSIPEGAEVVLVLLVNNQSMKSATSQSYGGGFCPNQTSWRPYHVPLRGTYDGYGGVKLQECDAASELWKHFQGDPLHSDDFRFYGCEWELSDFDASSPSELIRSIERGVVQVRAQVSWKNAVLKPDGFIDDEKNFYFSDVSWCPLGFMLILASVYDAMTATVPLKDFSKQLSTCVQNDTAYQVCHEMLVKQIKEAKSPEDRSGYEDKDLYQNTLKQQVRRLLCSEGERWLFLGDITPDYVHQAYQLQYIMTSLRKFYSPQSGAGSQYDNHNDVKQLCLAIAQACKVFDEENC